MTSKSDTLGRAEDLVRSVLKQFGQNADDKTVRTVAMKVSKVVPAARSAKAGASGRASSVKKVG